MTTNQGELHPDGDVITGKQGRRGGNQENSAETSHDHMSEHPVCHACVRERRVGKVRRKGAICTPRTVRYEGLNPSTSLCVGHCAIVNVLFFSTACPLFVSVPGPTNLLQ